MWPFVPIVHQEEPLALLRRAPKRCYPCGCFLLIVINENRKLVLQKLTTCFSSLNRALPISCLVPATHTGTWRLQVITNSFKTCYQDDGEFRLYVVTHSNRFTWGVTYTVQYASTTNLCTIVSYVVASFCHTIDPVPFQVKM